MRENKKDLRFRLGLLAAAALFGAFAYAEVTMQTVTPGQASAQTQTMSVARYVTNVVMNSSSNWERVDSNLPDSVYYKLAIETVTVTGGVRRFETKDYYINVSVTNYTTNVVFYTPYKELDHKVYMKVNPPKLDTPDMVELIEALPKVTLRELDPPKPPKQETVELPPQNVVGGDYVDYMNYSQISHDYDADDSAPLLSDEIFVDDPIERFNRTMFVVNDYAYTYFIGPVCKGYRFVVPAPARVCISQMDHNIVWPKRLINNLAQAKFKGAGVETARFLINSSVGIGGLFDPAKAWFDLDKYDEDTGQTFGFYGIGPGCYIFLPIAGPLTARDTVGLIFDEAMDPRTYLPFGGMVKTFMVMNNISLQVDSIDSMLIDNGDPYAFARDMWYLKRSAEIDE